MSKRESLTIAGAMVLIIGIFMPIFNVPVIGNISYFQNSQTLAIILALTSLASVVLIAAKMHSKIWISGFSSLAVVTYSFIDIQLKLDEIKYDIQAELGQTTIGQETIEGIHLEWGWIILFAGAFLIIIGSFIKPTREEMKEQKDNEEDE